MGTARLLDWLRRSRAARHAPADEETAELTASYWRAYDARMASVGLADVARRFPVRDDREGRALVGVSMGGFGAVTLALKHPERFAFVAALSPAIDVPRRRFTWRHLDQSRRFREIFGPDDSTSRRNDDPFVLVRSTDPATAPYFYMTCGQSEGLLAPNREFAAALNRYGVAHEFHAVPGGHNWNQWNGQLPALFDSLSSRLSANKERQ